MHTYLSPLELGLSRGCVLIVSGIEVGERGLVGLADVLELLDVATRGREIDLGNLERRADKECQCFRSTRCLTINSPKLGDLSLKLLLAGHIIILARIATVDAAGPTLIDGKLLLVALQLPRELLDALLEMRLAGLGCNEGLAGLAKFLGLQPNVNTNINLCRSRIRRTTLSILPCCSLTSRSFCKVRRRTDSRSCDS